MQNSGMENGQNLSIDDSQVKILVVDDHPNTANMLARAISRLGSHVEVVSATSGQEALQLVEDSTADILITDMMMPEMNGLELIEKLNDEPFSPPAFSFLITAHDTTEFMDTAERLNVKQVITKPVNPETICEIVAQALDEIERAKSSNKDAAPGSQTTTTAGSDLTIKTSTETEYVLDLSGEKNMNLTPGSTIGEPKLFVDIQQEPSDKKPHISSASGDIV
ncbi:MAG TPA: response regulator [Anaerolineales bacterium]|nr:response regulator [Anaerolineales bacterium]